MADLPFPIVLKSTPPASVSFTVTQALSGVVIQRVEGSGTFKLNGSVPSLPYTLAVGDVLSAVGEVTLNAVLEGALFSGDVADLNVSGTPNSGTFLRGDGFWATPWGRFRGKGADTNGPDVSFAVTQVDFDAAGFILTPASGPNPPRVGVRPIPGGFTGTALRAPEQSITVAAGGTATIVKTFTWEESTIGLLACDRESAPPGLLMSAAMVRINASQADVTWTYLNVTGASIAATVNPLALVLRTDDTRTPV